MLHPDRTRRLLGRRTGRRPDGGFTMTEILVAMATTGILLVAITMSLTTILKTSREATIRLGESKDVTFAQTWFPVDLSSAIRSFETADDAALQTELAALTPPMGYNAALGGTNVLTVVRPDLDSGAGQYYVVAYRYEQIGGDWQIRRYEIRNPGTASESVSIVGVVHEVATPPADGSWSPGTAPLHAVDIVHRNNTDRPVGEDVNIIFESGSDFTTGGGGLSAENQLPTDYSGGFTDPSAPPSRCGGRIALVIDTSGSVPANSGGIATEDAAAGFIDGFTGTPTLLTLNGFDREGYGMIVDPSQPTLLEQHVANGARAPYVSLLNAGTEVDTTKGRITDLDDLDGAWPGGGAPIADRDPDGNRIMWDQVGSGTNWEDGLYTVLFQEDGTSYGINQPELVVFVTDGEPNRVRSGTSSTGASNQDAADAAALIADVARDQGARVIGIMVGNKSTNSTYVGYLSDVVGGVEWNGTVHPDGTVDVGNALTADLFKGQFDKLGGILRSIMIAECGGTVTVQKRIDTGPVGTPNLAAPASGTWTYNTESGSRPLDHSVASSVTFDYGFAVGETVKTVQIVEQPVAGYVWDRAECTAGGVPVASSVNSDGSAGVTVDVEADQAVSCLMISRPL